ncbi:MAG: TSUP family transporter, partial [Gammaproteobacteria bacterium]
MAVPLLMGVLGLGLSVSAGLSLGAVALAALFGVALRWRRQEVVWPLVAVTGAGGMLLAPAGQWLSVRLDETWLVATFALLVMVIAVRMWRQAVTDPESTRVLRAGGATAETGSSAACAVSPSGRFEWRWPCMQRLLLAGAVTGLLSGLFGVGGGFVIVPMLVLISGLAMPQAVATSLAVIVLVSGSGFAG